LTTLVLNIIEFIYFCFPQNLGLFSRSIICTFCYILHDIVIRKVANLLNIHSLSDYMKFFAMSVKFCCKLPPIQCDCKFLMSLFIGFKNDLLYRCKIKVESVSKFSENSQQCLLPTLSCNLYNCLELSCNKSWTFLVSIHLHICVSHGVAVLVKFSQNFPKNVGLILPPPWAIYLPPKN